MLPPIEISHVCSNGRLLLCFVYYYYCVSALGTNYLLHKCGYKRKKMVKFVQCQARFRSKNTFLEKKIGRVNLSIVWSQLKIVKRHFLRIVIQICLTLYLYQMSKQKSEHRYDRLQPHRVCIIQNSTEHSLPVLFIGNNTFAFNNEKRHSEPTDFCDVHLLKRVEPPSMEYSQTSTSYIYLFLLRLHSCACNNVFVVFMNIYTISVSFVKFWFIFLQIYFNHYRYAYWIRFYLTHKILLENIVENYKSVLEIK